MNGQTKLLILGAVWIGGCYWVAGAHGPLAVLFAVVASATGFWLVAMMAAVVIDMMLGASDVTRAWIAKQFGYRIEPGKYSFETKWVKIGENE